MSDTGHHHIAPVKTYIVTFASLVTLTILTVVTSRMDLGILNIAVAVGIAVTKASIVVMFFMGLKWDKIFNTVILVSSVVFFLIFVGLTLADVGTRGHINPEEAHTFGIESKVKLIMPGEHLSPDHH